MKANGSKPRHIPLLLLCVATLISGGLSPGTAAGQEPALCKRWICNDPDHSTPCENDNPDCGGYKCMKGYCKNSPETDCAEVGDCPPPGAGEEEECVGLGFCENDGEACSYDGQCAPSVCIGGGHRPAASDCCQQVSVQCGGLGDTAGAALHKRKNIVLLFADDNPFCNYGFMAGRCAVSDGKTRCSSDTDCSPCTTGDCVCRNGYCVEPDGSCTDCAGDELCVDGLCSPRASCDEDAQCARGDHCDNHQMGGQCLLTPATCSDNRDCAGSQVCTSSQNPLRLNDLSCRNRNPDDSDAFQWYFDRDDDDEVDPPTASRVVFTPQLDSLAQEGAVFPRASAHAQNCKPARYPLLSGFHRHHGPVDVSNAPTIPWWLNPANSDYELLPNPGIYLDDQPYFRIFYGKPDFTTGEKFDVERQTGQSPSIGKFKCEIGAQERDSRCAEALRSGRIPTAAIDEFDDPHYDVSNRNRSVADLITDIRGRIGASGPPNGLANPFFVYWAPNLPHVDQTDSFYTYFQSLYGDPGDIGDGDSDAHLARASWFDAGLGAFVDELKRTCVCARTSSTPGGDGTPVVQSLYESTVLLILADHGYLLPRSKNAGPEGIYENAYRQTLIISAPEHRSGDAPHRVFDGQFAQSIDVLPTILAYAGVGEDTQAACGPSGACPEGQFCVNGMCLSTHPDSSPYFQEDHFVSTNLRPFVDNPQSSEPTPIHDVIYGNWVPVSSDSVPGLNERRHMVLRPGLLGLCRNGSEPELIGGHVKPCFDDSDCDPGQCERPAKRCINRPDVICTTDAECAVDLCNTDTSTCVSVPSVGPPAKSCFDSQEQKFPNPNTPCNGQCDCRYVGSFGDFALVGPSTPRQCTSDSQCVPSGVCKPLLISVRAWNESSVFAMEAFDNNWTPDQNPVTSSDWDGNLLALSEEYFGERDWGNNEPGDDDNPDSGSYQSCPTSAQLPEAAPADSLIEKFECCLREYWENRDIGGVLFDEPRGKSFKSYNCPPAFRAWTVCGDGVTQSTEECDDGNTDPDDGCTNDCTICGNGIITPPEKCDDGGECCTDGCQWENGTECDLANPCTTSICVLGNCIQAACRNCEPCGDPCGDDWYCTNAGGVCTCQVGQDPSCVPP